MGCRQDQGLENNNIGFLESKRITEKNYYYPDKKNREWFTPHCGIYNYENLTQSRGVGETQRKLQVIAYPKFHL